MEYGNFRKLQDYINSHIQENVQFEFFEIDEHFVYTFLSSLDTSKVTGLDGIGPRILKLSSRIITKSITYIAQKCLSAGEFPSS